MRFRISLSAALSSNVELVYRPNDYAFAVEPQPNGGITSAVVNTLSLELDPTGKIIHVWGYCPYMGWKDGNLIPPTTQNAVEFFIPDSPLLRGVSISINDGRNPWPVFVDRSSGWVRVTSDRVAVSSAEIMQGVIVELTEDGSLSALWLKPKGLP